MQLSVMKLMTSHRYEPRGLIFLCLPPSGQDSIHDYAFETLVSMHQDSKLARIQPIVLNCLGMLIPDDFT